MFYDMQTRLTYESPQAEAFTLHVEGNICTSYENNSNPTFGGTFEGGEQDWDNS